MINEMLSKSIAPYGQTACIDKLLEQCGLTNYLYTCYINGRYKSFSKSRCLTKTKRSPVIIY